MKLLAVDTSCDESCAAIIDTESWRLCSEVVHSHIDAMRAYGGVVPEVASREHLSGLPLAVDQALSQAGLKLSDIDWFGVTNRPGLVGALLVGVSYVKGLAFANQKPFTVFNHVEAHLFSPQLASLEGKEVPAYPWVALVVSGGHTELFLVKDALEYEWLGGTLDDAAGEAFDKIGKLLGLGYPAGPAMDKWVREKATEADRTRYLFPKARPGDLSFSFSGLKTAVAREVQVSRVISEADRLAVAASAQEAIVDAISEKLELAKKACGVEQVVITGGVACNSRLREKIEAYFPERRHCTDNAAMVAVLAGLYAKKELLEPSRWDSGVSPSVDFTPENKVAQPINA